MTTQYMQVEHANDQLCTETICELEQEVAGKDSIIDTHHSIEKGMLEQMELRRAETDAVNLRLHLSEREVQRKTRQNKWLRGGLLLLTGITASFTIINAKK